MATAIGLAIALTLGFGGTAIAAQTPGAGGAAQQHLTFDPAAVQGNGQALALTRDSDAHRVADNVADLESLDVHSPAVDSSRPAAIDAETGRALEAWSCDSGNICFFTGFNGTGLRCAWDVADPDWAAGNIICSWALTTNVASVNNKGTSDDGSSGVAFWGVPDFVGDRIGCIKNQTQGNLQDTYTIRSHKWISGDCGG